MCVCLCLVVWRVCVFVSSFISGPAQSVSVFFLILHHFCCWVKENQYSTNKTNSMKTLKAKTTLEHLRSALCHCWSFSKSLKSNMTFYKQNALIKSYFCACPFFHSAGCSCCNAQSSTVKETNLDETSVISFISVFLYVKLQYVDKFRRCFFSPNSDNVAWKLN